MAYYSLSTFRATLALAIYSSPSPFKNEPKTDRPSVQQGSCGLYFLGAANNITDRFLLWTLWIAGVTLLPAGVYQMGEV